VVRNIEDRLRAVDVYPVVVGEPDLLARIAELRVHKDRAERGEE
jgi:hypothetical protein